MNYKEFFNKRKIAIIGLGPHGEMVSDIKFLLRNKADITLYDMRSEKRLKAFLLELKDAGLEKYTFGKVSGDDLLESDLILISSEISKKSIFLKKAVQAEIQIEYPETLFFKLSPQVTLIGVLGLYGKSTVVSMIHSILKISFSDNKDQSLFFIDPDSSHGALTHLKKIKKGDLVLVRIPDRLMDFYHEIHISPHVAVITSQISFDILDFQTYNNFIIAPDEVIDAIKLEKSFSLKAKMLRTRASSIPLDWNIKTKGSHDKENAALVLQTSELFKISSDIVKDVVQNFLGLHGCVEFVKKVAGIEYYNDTNSITPRSTVSAIKSLSSGRNITLILGGAYTGYDYSEMIKEIPDHVLNIILLPGSGSLGIRGKLENIEGVNFTQILNLEDAVKKANEITIKGGRVVFSPAFDAVGVDISRKERGERFVRAVRGL